jgi:hypothetical protein
MVTIYRLQSDKSFIAQVQKATITTEEFGIEPMHGLFASSEWWQHIRDGIWCNRRPIAGATGTG